MPRSPRCKVIIAGICHMPFSFKDHERRERERRKKETARKQHSVYSLYAPERVLRFLRIRGCTHTRIYISVTKGTRVLRLERKNVQPRACICIPTRARVCILSFLRACLAGTTTVTSPHAVYARRRGEEWGRQRDGESEMQMGKWR